MRMRNWGAFCVALWLLLVAIPGMAQTDLRRAAEAEIAAQYPADEDNDLRFLHPPVRIADF